MNRHTSIQSALDGRFADMQSGLLHALRISSFKFWPATVNANKDFGNEEIHIIAEKLHESLTAAQVSLDELELEWNLLKKRVYARYNNVISQAKWEEIIPSLKGELPNISSFIDLLLAIPVSSAEAERGFSTMKQLKTKYRSNLQDDRVTDQLVIMTRSAPISEYDPLPAINLWNSVGGVVRRTSKMEDPDKIDLQDNLVQQESDESSDDEAYVYESDSDF